MKILFLMGGDNLTTEEDNYPLYMAEINQKTLLELQIDYSKMAFPSDYIFCIKNEHIKKFYIDEMLKREIDEPTFIAIHGNTKGALCTAMLAAQYLDNEEELLVVAVNDFTDENWIDIISYFRVNNFDAGVVSFKSIHPRYSFAKVDSLGEIIEVSEKKPISNNALVSFYYFKNARDFLTCSKNVIRKDNSINGLFYISQALNEIILKQKKIGMYKIDNSKFHPLKTKQQLAKYVLELNERMEIK